MECYGVLWIAMEFVASGVLLRRLANFQGFFEAIDIFLQLHLDGLNRLVLRY